MRYFAVALIATLGLGACGDPARHALGPFAEPMNPDGLITVDTVIDFKVQLGSSAPRIVSREDVRIPKMVGTRDVVASVNMNFVVDTSGFVIRNSVRIGWAPGREVADAFRDWLRDAQFQPIRRGGRPLRAAYRNLVVLFPGRG